MTARGVPTLDGARPLYAQKDHLQKAMQAPFLCRVTTEPAPDRVQIAVVPDGVPVPAPTHKLVPLEPTSEMVAAGAEASKFYNLDSEPENTAKAIYRRMLDAAGVDVPRQPTQKGGA